MLLSPAAQQFVNVNSYIQDELQLEGPTVFILGTVSSFHFLWCVRVSLFTSIPRAWYFHMPLHPAVVCSRVLFTSMWARWYKVCLFISIPLPLLFSSVQPPAVVC